MGRVKIALKRLEKSSCRQATYSKRKNGLVKKAEDLSILCDADIVLLTFSPGGKPTLFRGHDCYIDEIVEKLVKLTPQERAKRHLESLEILKKSCKKMDHEVDISQLLGPSYQSIEKKKAEVNLLRARLLEMQKRLSCWTNVDKVDSAPDLEEMEEVLVKSLGRIQTHKENLLKHQHKDLQCANQFKKEMKSLLCWDLDQQLQPFPCSQNDLSPEAVLPKDLSLSPRDIDYSAVSSFKSYAALLGKQKKIDGTKIGLVNDIPIESARMEPPCSQQYLQQAYPPYNFRVLRDNLGPHVQMNVQESTSDYCINAGFGLHQLGYNPIHHNWASTSRYTAASMFGEQLFQQQYYQSDAYLAEDYQRYLQASNQT